MWKQNPKNLLIICGTKIHLALLFCFIIFAEPDYLLSEILLPYQSPKFTMRVSHNPIDPRLTPTEAENLLSRVRTKFFFGYLFSYCDSFQIQPRKVVSLTSEKNSILFRWPDLSYIAPSEAADILLATLQKENWLIEKEVCAFLKK
jgi:hypothetical protein